MFVFLATVFALAADWDIVKAAVCQETSSTVGTLSNTGNCNTVAGQAFGFTTTGTVLSGAIGITFDVNGFASEAVVPGGSTTGIIANGFVGLFLDNHAFATVCFCKSTGEECPAPVVTTTASGCAIGSFAIKTSTGFVCLKIDATLSSSTDTTDPISLVSLTDGGPVTVTIDNGAAIPYDFGRVATANSGTEILGLALANTNTGQGLFFSACGPLIIETGTDRKRNIGLSDIQAQSLGAATRVVSSGSAVGDPHLAGPNGIKLDVYGKPAANYSLVVAPSFEINMQLADRGPELRFMKKLTVLYRGTSFTIVPWTVKTQRDALVAHFEALGAKVTFDIAKLRIIIEICAGHTIEFVSSHTDIPFAISYLDFAMTVPGCHNAYGGLLGQTYQCKYATEKFEWSRDREDAFLVPTLETPSGTYSATTSCANEDEYRGEVIRGSSVGGGNSTLEMTATQQERRRRL